MLCLAHSRDPINGGFIYRREMILFFKKKNIMVRWVPHELCHLRIGEAWPTSMAWGGKTVDRRILRLLERKKCFYWQLQTFEKIWMVPFFGLLIISLHFNSPADFVHLVLSNFFSYSTHTHMDTDTDIHIEGERERVNWERSLQICQGIALLFAKGWLLVHELAWFVS